VRYDLQIIASFLAPGARVLDLGCGAGDLLSHLIREKGITGAGIEIDEAKVAEGLTRGLSVLHGDINEEIRDYPDRAFDDVILSQTLQQVYDPARLIREMLRVGRRGIVSFPNFAHFGVRAQLFFKGRAPVSRELPYQWYDTPNIRVIALKDFRRFCKTSGFSILRETAITTPHHQETGRVTTLFPNLLATYGIFLLGRPDDAPNP
jgi:methionine biosynthesis protein MetW